MPGPTPNLSDAGLAKHAEFLPTRIASGAETTEAARLVCDHLSRSIPSARTLRVAGAGHSPMRTPPDLFVEALRGLTDLARGI